MATPPFSDIAKEELTCPLCYELFLDPHNPKDLDCPHVCCQICLKRLVGLTEDGQRLYLDCPECRQTTMIPPGGIAAMKTNIRLRSLAEKHQQHQVELIRASEIPICAEHEGQTKHFYCTTCEVAICQFCLIEEHQGSHSVKEVRHVGKQRRSELTSALNEAERDLEKREKELREILELERKLERTVRYEEYKIDTRAETIVVDIYKRCNQMKAEIRAREQPRIDRIRAERMNAEKRVQERKRFQEASEKAKYEYSDHDYIEVHDTLLSQVRMLTLSAGKTIDVSHSDRMASVTTFEPYPPELMDTKLGRLAKADDSFLDASNSSDDAVDNGAASKDGQDGGGRFTKGPNRSSKDGKKKLGPFRITRVRRSKSTSSFETAHGGNGHPKSPSPTPVSPNNNSAGGATTASGASVSTTMTTASRRGSRRNREAHLLCQFGDYEIARGITTTADQKSIVIADHSRREIAIYGVVGEELKQKACFQLSSKNNHYPWDVAVTVDDRFLVARETSVEIYSPDGQFESALPRDIPGDDISNHDVAAREKGCEDDEGIRSVITTTYGRIIVGNVVRSTVTVYSSTKTVQKVIRVGIEPWHLASNGKTVAFSLLRAGKVSVVDIETEQELITFHVEGGPRGLLYDEATGSLLVSSWERQSVEQYCSTTGDWLGTVASGLNCPDGLFMTSKGRLAVADTSTVKVFRVV